MWGMYQLQKWGYVLWKCGVCISCRNGGYVLQKGGVCVMEMGGMYLSVAEMGVCVVEMGGMCCGNVGYVSVAEMV